MMLPSAERYCARANPSLREKELLLQPCYRSPGEIGMNRFPRHRQDIPHQRRPEPSGVSRLYRIIKQMVVQPDTDETFTE